MPDDPIIITGGSLKIKVKGNLKDNGGGDYDYDRDGTITGVEIDGQTYSASKNSRITIHYDVPDTLKP
ncbi:MAG TPA: hypothetical protein VNA19_03255 [Pyrinomonadaceae bacterium]|jgi:hypothetical protein|nr:hypothetical protein [Pyrinomonadaceae bacterium]